MSGIATFKMDGGASFGLLKPGVMVRRILKPFTVEVRRSGRKPASAATAAHDPTLTSMPDDQPLVSWPGFDESPEPANLSARQDEAPRAVAGRILPALDEPRPAEQSPEPERKQTAKAMLAAKEAVPAAADSVEPPEPVTNQVEDEPAVQTADEDQEPVAPSASARIIAAAVLLRPGRKRLSRDQFTRGERWKARLPAAALAGLRRPARRPKG